MPTKVCLDCGHDINSKEFPAAFEEVSGEPVGAWGAIRRHAENRCFNLLRRGDNREHGIVLLLEDEGDGCEQFMVKVMRVRGECSREVCDQQVPHCTFMADRHAVFAPKLRYSSSVAIR